MQTPRPVLRSYYDHRQSARVDRHNLQLRYGTLLFVVYGGSYYVLRTRVLRPSTFGFMGPAAPAKRKEQRKCVEVPVNLTQPMKVRTNARTVSNILPIEQLPM